MIWLMLALAAVIVIGPVLYLVPSARDKRLMKLRQQARTLGLGVKITRVPKLDADATERVSAGGEVRQPVTECVAYQLPVSSPLNTSGQMLLLKIPARATMPVQEVINGWSLDTSSDAAFWRLYQGSDGVPGPMMQCLNKLPDDTLGFSVSSRGIDCYWLEKATVEDRVVEKIKAALEIVALDLEQRFGKEN